MKKKTFLIIIIMLFMVVFVPKVVSAETDYEKELKVAYKSVPEINADVNVIDKFIKSDVYYNSGNAIKKVDSSVLEAWQNILNSARVDSISRNKYTPSYNYVSAYVDNMTTQISTYSDDIKVWVDKTINANAVGETSSNLYICESQTVENWYGGTPYGMTKEYYQYNSSQYSSGEHYKFGVKNEKVANTYKIFKSKKNKVKMDTYNADGMIMEMEGTTKNNVCSDEYSSKVYTYDEYKKMVAALGGNEITVEQLKNYSEGSSTSSSSTYEQCKDDNNGWWKCAWQFLDAGSISTNQLVTGEVNSALTSIKDLIFDVGNVIFILVTAFLGVKYIWGGVDSKFSVKNSLMTLVVAAIVFYGWDAVTNVLNVKGLFTGTEASGDHMSMVNMIYNTVMYIINFAAVGGIIYIGIKYMMAGAEGKSELKLKGIPVVMGIIMVYGTINLINFILKIVEGL